MSSKDTCYCLHYSFNFLYQIVIFLILHLNVTLLYLMPTLLSKYYFIDFRQPSGFRHQSEYVNLTFLNFLVIQTYVLIWTSMKTSSTSNLRFLNIIIFMCVYIFQIMATHTIFHS